VGGQPGARPFLCVHLYQCHRPAGDPNSAPAGHYALHIAADVLFSRLAARCDGSVQTGKIHGDQNHAAVPDLRHYFRCVFCAGLPLYEAGQVS